MCSPVKSEEGEFGNVDDPAFPFKCVHPLRVSFYLSGVILVNLIVSIQVCSPVKSEQRFEKCFHWESVESCFHSSVFTR